MPLVFRHKASYLLDFLRGTWPLAYHEFITYVRRYERRLQKGNHDC